MITARWITPSEPDILTRLSGAEMDAFRSAALAPGQPDPVPAQISAVVDYMRGYILQGCRFDGDNAPPGTIPAEGLHIFLDLIVPVIEKRPVGAVIDVSGVRLDARRDAVNWLRWASECPSRDTGSALIPGASGVPTFSGRRRRMGRELSDGL